MTDPLPTFAGGLDRARDLAGDLAGDLARGRDLARDLARTRDLDLDRDLALDLAVDLARTRDRTRDLARDLDRARDHRLAVVNLARDLDDRALRDLNDALGDRTGAGHLDHDPALGPARTLTRTLTLAHTRACGLNRDLANARSNALAFYLDRAVARSLDLAHDLGADLGLALALARGFADGLEEFLRTVSRLTGVADTPKRPAGMARWTIGRAARVLPAAHQDRWREEYESELAELVGQGATRRQQLDYGLQVLFNAFSLRRSLRRPAAKTARDK